MQWTKPTSKTIGGQGETIALHHLESAGLTLLTQNFHSRFGEIDLVMKEEQTIVFVEVKYRKQIRFGHAADFVTTAKQKKIRLSATSYLQHCQLNAYNTPCRFDVVGLEGDLNAPAITWLKNAF